MMVMNDDSSKLNSSPYKHPVQRSLSVFPVLSNHSSGVISINGNSVLKESRSKRKKNRIPSKVRFDTNITELNQQGSQSSSKLDRDELLYIKQTKSKLEKVADLLPEVGGTGITPSPSVDILQLPPITPRVTPHNSNSAIVEQRSMRQEQRGPDYRAYSLPIIPREKPCTCKKTKSMKNLDKVLKKCIAKEFRAEESPPLFSIYVRWKNRRNGTSEYDQETLREVFEYFGTVAKIILKSKTSAIVVFHHVESACNADKVMQSVGKDLKIHVRWLNEMRTE